MFSRKGRQLAKMHFMFTNEELQTSTCWNDMTSKVNKQISILPTKHGIWYPKKTTWHLVSIKKKNVSIQKCWLFPHGHRCYWQNYTDTFCQINKSFLLNTSTIYWFKYQENYFLYFKQEKSKLTRARVAQWVR
jgi:hypothetical protein